MHLLFYTSSSFLKFGGVGGEGGGGQLEGGGLLLAGFFRGFTDVLLQLRGWGTMDLNA